MRHNTIIAHYVCGGLFDEQFAVTNGSPSIEMFLLTVSTSPFGSRFIIGRLLYICGAYVEIRMYSRARPIRNTFLF